MDATDLLTVQQLAKRLNCAERSIHAWMREGKIPPPIRIAGRLLRWRAGDINEWVMAGCPIGKPTNPPTELADRMARMRAARRVAQPKNGTDADKPIVKHRKDMTELEKIEHDRAKSAARQARYRAKIKSAAMIDQAAVADTAISEGE